MQNKDFTKDQFINFWGKQGYVHTWDAYDKNYTEDILRLIKIELGDNKHKTTLEIGAGGGYWTNHLASLSKTTYALDVIKKPESVAKSVIWKERDSMQFNCKGIKTESIDFVFCYGVFCHFSLKGIEEYLADIKRVMKKDASAIIMFAEEKSFGGAEECAKVFGHSNNYATTIEMVERVGFNHKKLLEFRHTLLLLTKK